MHDDQPNKETSSESVSGENLELAGGEDDSSTERNGDDSHLHEDQKAPKFHAAESNTEGNEGPASLDDTTRTQDLAKAGRADFDPNVGQD